MKTKSLIISIILNVLLLVALFVYSNYRERQARLDVRYRTWQAFKQLAKEDRENQKPERTVGLKEAFTIFDEANPVKHDEQDLLDWLNANEPKK